jgi:NAD(P)-dependent dehydrogenase (short-subunit alcohol dehydrogenase family)
MEHNAPTALVTGASRGLGLALARSLAADGWRLVIDGRDPAALAEAAAELNRLAHASAASPSRLGPLPQAPPERGAPTVKHGADAPPRPAVVALPGDVGSEEHRLALAEAAVAIGGVDVVVHNASLLGPSPQPTLADYPLERLREVYSVNVFAPLRLTQLLLPHLRPGARLVFVTSDAAVEAYPGWGGYGSSKAALEQLAAVLGAEHPELRVYAVDPGDMNTRMHQEAFPGEDISDRPPPEASVPGLREILFDRPPSGRYQARSLPVAVSR